jgi:hypothetical protein
LEKTRLRLCPLCSSPALTDAGNRQACSACGTIFSTFAAYGFIGPTRYRLEVLPKDYGILGSSILGRALNEDSMKKLPELAYMDKELAEIAAGRLDVLRPVTDMYNTVFFEQLHENVRLRIKGLQHEAGEALSCGSGFQPQQSTGLGLAQNAARGNLLITDQRLIFTSSTYTFIRLDRKLSAVVAFNNALAIQRQGEKEAIYFIGLRPIEAALSAAIIMGQAPHLREGGGTPA